MPRLLLLLLVALLALAVVPFVPVRVPDQAVAPTVTLADRAASDQDDMCVWVNPSDSAKSLVIASDKHANKLFVYDLDGKTIQTVEVKHPGNIDTRQGFPLAGKMVDVVAVNLRGEKSLAVFKIDPDTRKLTRIDDGTIATGDNYGGCLFKSAKTGKLYAITTSYAKAVAQFELFDDNGTVRAKKLRQWKVGGVCEAAVADDATGRLFVAEEGAGVWELGAEPDDPAPGAVAIKVGQNGLKGDVEGLALFPTGEKTGYLIVSDQGKNTFRVYRREGTHTYVGAFAVKGAVDTDGLEVVAANLGPRFPDGLFACHTAAKSRCAVLLTPWSAIAKSFDPPLALPNTQR
jgi:3-phytase